MSISARLVNNPLIQAKVTPQDRVLVTNYQINANTLKIGDLFNVDTSTAIDGSMLIYNASVDTWNASVSLDNINTIINGGNF
jgi:hypothetical protein|tara:strand:- start:238 stop:483 length:246 start_codon:yes stop_codon:yes gene_type:complete